MTKKLFASLLVVVACAACAACGGSQVAVTRPAPPTVAVVEPPPVVVAVPPVVIAAPLPPPPAPEVAFLQHCRDPLVGALDGVDTLLNVTDKRTQANTLDAFNNIQRLLDNAAELANLMEQVHPDPKVREAARTCEQEASKLSSDIQLDRRIYDALKSVDIKTADADTKRFVSMTLRDYHRAGVDLDDAKRARLKAIDDETTQLGQQFEKNVAEDTRYIEVKDPAKLAGLPADWIAAHKPDATGVIKISTDYPDYIPFSSYATDDDLRKQLYIQFRLRGAAHNEDVLQKILVLRAEKAKLLGFSDWADYESDDKMLRTGKAEAAFIARIAKLAQARSKRDYAELLAQLRTHDPKATAVGDWQKAWLETEIKKQHYDVDDSKVREYFVYEKVLAGLLDITSQIYDIRYIPVPDAETWHPDVQVFDVMRKDQHLGRIFLDMHPRDGKFKHAAQFPIKDGVLGEQMPEGALVCNLPDPKTSAGPALMSHDDVVTMFHEFGHLMHHVLGGHHHWVRQSGVATEADFVEAPSEMFEEWGKSYETLSRFAKHYQTGEVIPKELVAKMRKAEHFGVGTWIEQQVFYAALSLELHRADPAKVDQLAMVKALQAKYTPFAFVDGTKFHTSFGHLIGYSSRYYTYLWSFVIAKDLLTAFKAKGLMDTGETLKYRDKILMGGGTKDAADLVHDFLGRPFSFAAFEQYLSE